MFPAFDALQVAIRITRAGGAPPPSDMLHHWTFDNVDATFVYDEGTGSTANMTKHANISHNAGISGDGAEISTHSANPLRTGRVQDIVDSSGAWTVSYWIKRDGSTWTLPGPGTISMPLTMMADFTNRGWYVVNGNDANDGGILLVGDWTSYQIAGYTGLGSQGNGVWNHVVFTYTQSVYTAGDGVCKTYFNGSKTSTYTGLGLAYHQHPSGNVIALGRNRTNETATNMELDDIRYYDYVLTATEIENLYQEFS